MRFLCAHAATYGIEDFLTWRENIVVSKVNKNLLRNRNLHKINNRFDYGETSGEPYEVCTISLTGSRMVG